MSKEGEKIEEQQPPPIRETEEGDLANDVLTQ
jgi:hypothetical protein